jgi:hypothetical protein
MEKGRKMLDSAWSVGDLYRLLFSVSASLHSLTHTTSKIYLAQSHRRLAGAMAVLLQLHPQLPVFWWYEKLQFGEVLAISWMLCLSSINYDSVY